MCSRREHAALDGGADAFAELLGERRLCGSIKFQPRRLGHAAVVHDFRWFLVLFSGSEEGQLGGQRNATAMNIKAVIIASCLAVATPAAAQSIGEVVTPNFEHAIPKFLANRWSPWSSIMRRGERRTRAPMPGQPSSTPMLSRASLSRR
jgi:hypothetical protein